MNRFDRTPPFEREYRRLLKKYQTLAEDLRDFERVLEHFPTGSGKNFTIIYSGESVKIVKARMASRALRERSLRIIYAYFEGGQRIVYVELYFKGDKENEDRERIRDFLRDVHSEK